MAAPNFFAELKRRNVYKVAVAYAIVGWLVIQIASTILPTFHAPEWVLQTLVVLVLLGFAIALVIAWAFEMTPEGMKRTANVPPDAKIPYWSRQKFAVVFTCLALIAAGLLAWQLVRKPAQRQSASEAAAETAQKSIAVLPFDNLSDDKSNAYFAEGIQDEILTRLSKIAALKVISRTSTQKYKSAPDNLREVGRQLGVANLLEGSVQKIGNAAHISVQLIRVATDEHLWAESYNRKLDDVFAVEGEVASAIADQLNAKLTGAEEKAITDKPTQIAAAYEAYLRGKALLWEGNENALRASILSYEEAVRLDPQFALAWAGLSSARSVGFYYMGSTSADRTAAEQSLAKAEALQPQLPEIQLAQANFGYFVAADDRRGREVLEQLHLAWPNNDEVLQLLAFTYQRLGEWQKAIEAFGQVIVLNP